MKWMFGAPHCFPYYNRSDRISDMIEKKLKHAGQPITIEQFNRYWYSSRKYYDLNQTLQNWITNYTKYKWGQADIDRNWNLRMPLIEQYCKLTNQRKSKSK